MKSICTGRCTLVFSWRAVMTRLNVWFIVLLLATAQRRGNRRRNWRRDWGRGGVAAATDSPDGGASSGFPDGDWEGVNSTCRDEVPSGNHTRRFNLISPRLVQLDPFAAAVHLNGEESKTQRTRTDRCLGNIALCTEGFAAAIWLLPKDTSVGEEGAYYFSTGAQRAESCGFYFRLNSVNSSDGFSIGVFDIGVATSDFFWQVRYQATMSQKAHVLMAWSPDLGLDVTVDGWCAGSQTASEGYQRDPVASCSDDPFTFLYVGGRNDMVNGGYAVVDIGQLTIWNSWKNPDDIYNPQDEGVQRAYYVDCVTWESLSSVLEPSSNLSFFSGSFASSPWQCRAYCAGHQYAAIGGDPMTCYCLTNYTNSESNPKGSCTVCSGYTNITCGSADSLSLYQLSSFRNTIPAREAIQGFAVSLDGVSLGGGDYTVTTQKNVNVNFSTSAGEDVWYAIYGDERLKEIQTFETSTYLFFPEAGLYHLTVSATNEISQSELELWVTAEDDPAQSGNLFLAVFSDGVAATSEPTSIWLEIANGSPSTACNFDFGDGSSETVQEVQAMIVLTHRYENPGIYLVTASCGETGGQPINASTVITIQERVAITLDSTFRVLKGTDLTVPFQINGTNITDLVLLFDGITSATNHTCTESFTCEGYIGQVLTNSTGTHVFEVRASNVISGLVSARADIYVGVPIRNFSCDVNATAVISNEGVRLTAYISEGSLVYFNFDFDGNSTVFRCPMAPCEFSHTQGFPEAGVFKVSVEVSNDFNAFTSEVYSVKVYNPVPPLSVQVINSSSIHDPIKMTIRLTSNTSMWPTEANATFSITGFQNQPWISFTPSSAIELSLIYYLSIPVYGRFEVTINVSNALSSAVIKVPIQIGKEITGFYTRLSSPVQATGDNVSLEFGVDAGSGITVIVDFGDGTTKIYPLGITESLDDPSTAGSTANTSASTMVYHKYDNPGNYIINVRAQSAFGQEVSEVSLTIINQIRGLRVHTNSTDKATGSAAEFVFYLERGAAIPQLVHCLVDYGDSSEIDTWNASLSDDVNVTTEHIYNIAGFLQVQANCSNRVSNVTLSVDINVHVATTGCSVSSDFVVAATNTTVQYYAILSTGSDVDVVIEFGDGSNDTTHIDRINNKTGSLIFEHIYDYAGSFITQLTASNPLGQCVVYSIPVVVEVPIIQDGYRLLINPSTVDLFNQITVFTVILKEGTLIPTNVTAYWTFGDGNSSSLSFPMGATRLNTLHTYQETGEYHVTVHLFNLVSDLDLNGTLVILKPIADIDYNVSTVAAVGANITLSILVASGSSIAYVIDYGDGLMNTGFQEEPDFLQFMHSYDQVGQYILTIKAENGLGRVVFNHTEIRVAYPVQGLILMASDEVIYSPGNITLSLTLAEGVPLPTNMDCVWRRDLHDGVSILTRMENVTVAPGGSLNTTHHFPGGRFVVSLKCKNILGSLTLQKEITVYEAIRDLGIASNNLITEAGHGVLITVITSRGSLLNYIIQFGDETEEDRFVILSKDTKRQDFYHVYTKPGLYTPSVSAGNILGESNATWSGSIEVLHSTRGLQLLSNGPVTLPETMVKYTLTPQQGVNPPSRIHLEWDFGDDTAEDVIVNFNNTFTITHFYNASGTYQTSVTVSNKLDSHIFATTVIINPEVEPLRVSFEYSDGDGIWRAGFGPDFNWFPAGSDIKLSANATLNDASILWEFSNGESSSQKITYHRFEAPGTYNITLKVHSKSDVLEERQYIFYIVKALELLLINPADEMGKLVLKSGQRVDFTLSGNGLNGPACISWHSGDQGQQTVYGPGPCGITVAQTGIFIQSSHGQQYSHTYTLPGYYLVNVLVSNFYSTASKEKNVTVIGCWSPPDVSIKGPGQSIDAPRSHRTSEAILLDSVVSLDCFGISSTTLKWEAYKLVTDKASNSTQKLTYDVPSENGPQLDLKSGSLEVGLYEISITVMVDGFQNVTGYGRVYISIEDSPLVLVLEGGSARAVGDVHPIILDAMASSYDPNNGAGGPSDWSFQWSCRKLSDSGVSYSSLANSTLPSTTYLCDNSSWERLDFGDAVVQLDPMQLRAGAVYVFRVEAAVDSRRASYEQTVEIVKGEPPHVSISCVANCRGKTNPTASFTLQGRCDNCDTNSQSLFTWSLYVKQQDNGDFQVVENLSDMTSTGISKQGIAFNPDQLEGGREYRLRLDVTDQSLGDGFTQYSFLTNLPPYNGSCHITPTIGYAITTEFSLNCTGWLDEGHAENRASISQNLAADQVLQYRVMGRLKGETTFSLKTSGADSFIAGMIFGLGPEEFGYIHELQISVVDVYGAAAHVDLMVTVESPSMTGDDILSLVSSNGSSLSLLVSSGNIEGATQLISAVLSILPDQQDGNSSLTDEDLTELRSDLVSELSAISVWATTADSLLQASVVMAQSLTGGVNDKALVDAAAAMAGMAHSIQGLDTDNPEVIISTAEGLTSGLGSLIAQSDGLVQSVTGTDVATLYTTTPPSASSETDEPVVFDAYGDDLSPEEIAEQAAEAEEERERNERNARAVALTISMLAQESLELVSEVVMGQRVGGQPPLTLNTEALVLEVFKDDPGSVAERAINAEAGSFQLPNASLLFEGSGAQQVEQTILSYNTNPYSFSTSSENIGSKGVLALEFNNGQGAPLLVRNLSDPISITLEVDESQLEGANTIRMSFTNISSMLYQKVELGDEDVDLRVIFREMSDDSSNFLVYLRKGTHPDENTYDAFMEIPRILGDDESWHDEELVMEATHTAVFSTSVLSGVGDYFLGVSLAESLDSYESSSDIQSISVNETATSYELNVTLVIYAAGCRYWDANITAWSSDGCQVGPQTTSRSTHCLCNHLSSFAASFFVPPNSIDFATVFSKFLDLGNNAAVFSTVLGFFGLYLILLVWLRRKDKQDIVKWGVSPLADNHLSYTYYYQVTVQTGMGLGCGTRSKVSITLTGEDGDSGMRLLDDDKRKVFERGSICHFLMGVARPLGPLSYLKICHDNSGRGQLASWYLSQVSITDLQTGQQFFFVCDRWLAVDEDDGSIERVLPVATRSDLTQFSKLFYSSSRRNLFDEHIWFSLFSRPTRSNFTRVQRLSCCLCLLYLSMIASAMFYRAEEAVENPTALRLGPFIFTPQQVFVGFISALVVVPVNLIIVQLFRKSKPSKSQTSAQLPRHLQDKLDNLKDGSSESSTPVGSIADFKTDKDQLVPEATSSGGRGKEDKKRKKQPLMLPHWCVYVAWLLLILSSFTAAFFTVLYSLEWGQQKSCEWLTSMLVSLVNSVLIIQPVKVIAVAIIIALIFKKPSKMDIEIDDGFTRDQNKLKNDEELLHDPSPESGSSRAGLKYRFRPQPSKAELEEARRRRLKERKMNRILKETGVYTIFVAILLFLCYSSRDGMSFYMSQSLRDIFLESNGVKNMTTKLHFSNLEKSTPDLFWDWVEGALIPGLYGDTYYNGDPMHWRHTRFLSDWQNYRVGPVRLRQLRVMRDPCHIPPQISILHPRCFLGYSWSNQEEGNFAVGWRPQNLHNSHPYSDKEKAPWIYHDYLELNGVPHPGILAVYSGGGYVAEFGTTIPRALSIAKFLREAGWYDELTRAIFVEFSVYNANINLFSVATLLAETSSTGGAIVTSHVHTLRLYHYEETLAVITIIFQVIFVAYLLYFLVKVVLAVKKGGLKELKNFWTAIELAVVLIAIAAVVMFAFRQVFIQLALQEVKNKDEGEFVNFSHIAKWDELFGYLLAGLTFVSLIRYMRLLRLNARMSLLGLTLNHASKDILYFLLMWNLVFFAFGQLAYILFHSVVMAFSSFITTLETLFAMLLGKFDFDSLVEANRVLGGAVFVIYIMTMYMILTNMFITIVVEAFTHMRHKEGLDEAADPEMVEFMMEKFKAFFLRPLQGGSGGNQKAEAKAEMPYEDQLDSLEQRVDKLVGFVETNYGKLEKPRSNDGGATGSPARSPSHISLHSSEKSSAGTHRSPKKTCRVILIA